MQYIRLGKTFISTHTITDSCDERMKRYESSYECQECEAAVHPVSYRAACPDCGGSLQTSVTRLSGAKANR
nr:zinc-ribbon domain-containing protein [Natronolimnobius baerhuensis]